MKGNLLVDKTLSHMPDHLLRLEGDTDGQNHAFVLLNGQWLTIR